MPASPIVTYAAPIPEEPAAREAVSTAVAPGPTIAALSDGPPIVAAPAVSTPIAAPVVSPPAVVLPVQGAVPESATWLMVITGVGAIGAGLRRRRGRVRAAALGLKVAGGATMWGATAAAEAGDVAATVAVKSAVASAAGKAMLCICPAAVVAGSVVAVPPLRQAVHAATIPAEPRPAIAGNYRATVPCDSPMTVPVSATAIKGFPDTVTTVTSPAPSAAPSTGATTAIALAALPAQAD